jgi:hypothetical protein
MPPPRTPAWTRWALIALVLLRLVFISHDEIRAYPYDETAYVLQARAWYWGNHYCNWTYTRQPGYPLFLALGSMLGIPARLAIEAVWIAGALAAVRAMRGVGLRPSGGVLVFTLLLFHPFSTELFTRALADNLYTVAWLVYTVALGAAIGAGNARSIGRWGVLAGLAGAVAMNTRQESVLVYALGLVAAITAAISWRGARRSIVTQAEPLDAARELAREGPFLGCLGRRRLVVGALLPIAIAFSAELAVKAANHARIGAWVGYDWSLPGFKALYRTMLSIPPADPTLRVPIPRDVREAAANASPTFAAMREVMEHGEACADYRRHGQYTTGIEGEPGSFNLWTMREAVWTLHAEQIRSAADYDALCWKVVEELRAAQSRGTLGRRWAPMSFIPPEWTQLVTRIPASLPVCWSHMTRITPTRGNPPTLEPSIVQGYNEVTLRRQALTELQRPTLPDRGPWQHRSTVREMDEIKRRAAGAWPVLSWMLVSTWLTGWIAAAWTWRRGPARGAMNDQHRAWVILATIVTASLAMRTLLVMTLDATGVVASHRYMFPSAALLVVAGILGLRRIVTLVRPEQARPD